MELDWILSTRRVNGRCSGRIRHRNGNDPIPHQRPKTRGKLRHSILAKRLGKVSLVAGVVLFQLGLSIGLGFATTTNVNIQGFSFSPSRIIMTTGQAVNWTNSDPVSYTLWFTNSTDGSTYLLSPPISPGATWVHTFTSAASLNYYDFDRLWINGTLTVLPNTTVGGQVIGEGLPIFSNPAFIIAALALGTAVVVIFGGPRRTNT